MGLGQKLVIRQGQSLVMTPQLSQSIKLLALSNIELAAFVESEIERNPLLESATDTENVPEITASGTPDVQVELSSNNDLEVSAKALSENLGTSIENLYPDEQDYRVTPEKLLSRSLNETTQISAGGVAVSGHASSHDSSVSDYSTSLPTLRESLGEQLAIAGKSRETTLIATDIIEHIDDAGYFTIPLSDIAERLGCAHGDVQQALELVQGFDPVGVGARDLAECLKLQLASKNRLDPAIEAIIDNLPLLARRDFDALGKISGLSIEDMHDAMLEIQALDPKPGTAFESSPVQHVAPDVYVNEAPDGSWQIELNSETLPKVLINNSYIARVGSGMKNQTDKEFISNCVQTANWLTKSLDQRAQTILKVAREIVKQQDSFLVHGVRQLRPLTLAMVADAIDMHESTVSRVTSNKYMMTPRGLFELKYFFSAGISATDSGNSHSSTAVRDRIRELIANETAKSILSDDALVDMLRTDGVEIARRTVAKYREGMQIPSSVQRRREKRAQATASQNRLAEKALESSH